MSKRLSIALIVLALAGVAAAVATCSGDDSSPREQPPAGVERRDAGSTDATLQDVGVDAAWVAVEVEEGDFVALIDGKPVSATFTLGAAGHYPPAVMTGSSIALPEPAQTMDGRDIDVIEAHVVSEDGTGSFWDAVHRDANAVELTPSRRVRVRVVDLRGKPRAGLDVRLGREVVGLIQLHATTDAEGWATFEGVPDGEYVATLDERQAPVIEVVAGAEAELYAEPGRGVRGTVRGPDGKPAAGATVAVFGTEAGVDPLGDLPTDIVETGADGRFEVTGVRGSQFAVVVTTAAFEPAIASKSPLLRDDVEFELTLQKGRNVRVRVVDEQERPIEGATVRWVDPVSGAGGAALSKAEVAVELRALPSSAELTAAIGSFESSVVAVSAVGADVVDLVLRNTDRRFWRYRVEMPRDIPLLDLNARDGAGGRCGVSTSDGRDFTLTQCGEGDLTLEVSTPLGVATIEVPFEDGAEVAVPRPTPVEVRVEGVPDEKWGGTDFRLESRSVSAPLEVKAADDARVATARAYPGTWRFSVANARVGVMELSVEVADRKVVRELRLEARELLRLHVVDAYGAAVTGAYVMLFDNNDLVKVARSGGQLPTEFRVRAPFKGRVLAVDARRGEGLFEVTEATGSARVDMKDDVLTHRVPATRASREEFEARTQTKLVRSDAGFAIDVSSGSKAENAGLKRGDLLVTAWTEAGSMRVVVWRTKSGYVEILVP